MPINNNLYIEINELSIPDNTENLNKANDLIIKYQKQLLQYKKRRHINNMEFLILYESTISVLNYVGQLSYPLLDIEEWLEFNYTIKYKNSPELAKKLWVEHYHSIHRPYNLLKKRCFTILDELDELYIRVHKKNPPNWNI